ncbi:tetratricopeptide repeat protein [Baia soyae]|uniref:Tetratricopeptide repeat protein n=1 Tax=Baia soyae TaxID=1544746 RepID=A0A4R2RF91_9BACL|nr:tetratricopeptide repeat protein [Baia soyae]TCP61543.1 tetratricopeptide repeat protein [Baia soyae]
MNFVKIGKALRHKRKQLGKHAKELVCENLTQPTISNIERGVPTKIKSITLYAQQLDFDLSDVDITLESEEQKLNDLNEVLESISHTIDSGNPAEGLKRLKQLNISSEHPYITLVHYLKGRCYFRKGNLKQSEKHFLSGIRYAENSSEGNIQNVLCQCYSELSIIYYKQNNIQKALVYIDIALNSFDSLSSSYDQNYMLYTMKFNKAVYLEKQERMEECGMILKELIKNIQHIDSGIITAGIYEVLADVNLKMKNTKEAIYLAEKGRGIARRNQLHDRNFALWIVLGSAYLIEGKLIKAENCISTALTFENKLTQGFLASKAYTKLGYLCMLKEEYHESNDALSRALSIAEKHNNDPLKIKALIALGKLNSEIRNFKESIFYFEEALPLAKRLGLEEKQYLIAMELVNCWKEINRERSIHYLELAHRLYMSSQKKELGYDD